MSFEVIIINLVISVPVYFICRKIFKNIKDDKRKRLVIGLATIVITPVLYTGLIVAWVAALSYYPEKDFNTEKWNSDADKRYEMTDDLIESKILMGKTKQDVVNFLGQAEADFNNSQWSYYIGFKPGLINIDPDVLEIEFKDNKVVKCWTHGT